MKHGVWTAGLASVSLFLASDPALADVRLPGIFSDHMVLQQGCRVPVWGTAAPGEEVTVTFRGQTVKTVAASDGRWIARLAPLKAEPGQTGSDLTVAGRNSRTFRDVLVGEVWLGSGQSNMVWPVTQCAGAAEELAVADHPQIRLSSDTLWPNCLTPNGGWVVCASNTVRRFSALLYYFGRDLHREMKVPVGLISRAVSGSAAGPWISDAGFIADPGCQAEYEVYRRKTYPVLHTNYLAALAKWEQDAAAPRAKAAARLAAVDSGAAPYSLKLRIEGGIFFLTQPYGDMESRNIELQFDCDGRNFAEKVTGRAAKYNSAVHTGRVSVVRSGTNLTMDLKLTVTPDASVDGAEGDYRLAVTRAGWDCAGTFKGRFRGQPVEGKVTGSLVAAKDETLPPKPRAPAGGESPGSPGCGSYYTQFIAPIVPYALRGVLWDQGESGTGLRDISLPTLVNGMVSSWRKAWEIDFPFVFVQKPSGGGWNWVPGRIDGKGQPAARPALPADAQAGVKPGQVPGRAQFLGLRRIPNSAMAVASDLDAGLHPFEKRAYAERLLRCAWALAYGRDIAVCGPAYKAHTVDGSRVRVSFDGAGKGLEARGGEPLQGFAVAGPDGVFAWADAKIDGADVVVASDKVPSPSVVRYAWADSHPWANLFSRDGLPALPFEARVR